MSVRVRMAPSPTGSLHIGGVRTALFNWLFARHQGGEFLLRIENTDTSREVAEAPSSRSRTSLRWLGLDWDGPLTFQLDRIERLRRGGAPAARRGARRTRTRARSASACPTRASPPGTTSSRAGSRSRTSSSRTSCILRSDGRPTYNFASPIEDWLDGITHVIRGDDHISNTPKQINILRALGADAARLRARPERARRPTARSSRSGTARSRSTSSARRATPRRRSLNFLALLGWSYDDKTTIMSPRRAGRALHARARGREPGRRSTTRSSTG